ACWSAVSANAFETFCIEPPYVFTTPARVVRTHEVCNEVVPLPAPGRDPALPGGTSPGTEPWSRRWGRRRSHGGGARSPLAPSSRDGPHRRDRGGRPLGRADLG